MAAVRRVAIAALVLVSVAALSSKSGAGHTRNHFHKLIDVAVVSGYADTENSPREFVDVNNATATAYTRKDGLLVVRFGTESRCSGTVAGSFCGVRVLVDGLEASPIDDRPHFDSVGGGWQSNSIERSFSGLAKGNHTVVVQWATFGGSDTQFRMGAWHLTVESLK